MMDRQSKRDPSLLQPCRVAVVGPCASGKSTLTTALRERGYDAYAPAQEHSVISELWRHASPDIVIALSIDLATIRQRRGSHWPAWLHELQMRRLTSAYAAAAATFDTSVLSPSELIARTTALLALRNCLPASIGGE